MSPPVPVIPEKVPITPPAMKATGSVTFFTSKLLIKDGLLKISFKPDTIKTKPKAK